MLRRLHITDVGLIHDLDLELHPGLNVLTGETGAGKTMVVAGLSLALGSRASSHLVRAGASAARVQAVFDAPDADEDWAEDGEVILARSVGADGKSTARVGGQLTTATALTSLGSRLVEVHGQHQSTRLLGAATQTAFLDRSAGAEHLRALAAFSEAFHEAQRLRTEADQLEEASRDRAREFDLLEYQVREIGSVGPARGETAALEADEARLAHGERLTLLAATAETSLTSEGAATDLLAGVERELEIASALDPGIAGIASRAHGLAAEAAELARDVRAYREALVVDPERLEAVRDRIGALKGLQRKYGATDDEVLAFLEEAHGRLAGLAGTDQRLSNLRAELATREAEVRELAARVTEGRRARSGELAGILRRELIDLGMGAAQIEVRLHASDEPGSSGAERAELLLSPGEGQSMLPLAKAASGGELSRVMLACRSVLADLDDVPTLVFDEIDAGIGGEAGLAVGRRLALLAATRQVIVVTHLPQIACFADRHVRVRKAKGSVRVQTLGDDERISELSRMLAGLEASEHAVSHAEELLAEAAKTRTAVH